MSTTEIWISLIAFVLIYIVLGVADLVLMLRYARRGLPDETSEPPEAARRELPGAPYRRWRTGCLQLHTLWFIIIAFFWTGFFVLEGFDFGVGHAARVVGRTERGAARSRSNRSARSGTATRSG